MKQLSASLLALTILIIGSIPALAVTEDRMAPGAWVKVTPRPFCQPHRRWWDRWDIPRRETCLEARKPTTPWWIIASR